MNDDYIWHTQVAVIFCVVFLLIVWTFALVFPEKFFIADENILHKGTENVDCRVQEIER